MQLVKVIIHNFRSIKDVEFEVCDYSLLVGENDAGKTNFFCALRAFYEEGGFKYNHDRDFPKFSVGDEESWVELHFNTTADEQDTLKDEYKSPDGVLRVRRYFASKERVKPKQSNIYAYEGGELAENHFYGAANVSSSKLGSMIYIPAVSKVEDSLKTSGPSPFRDLINLVMKKAMASSDSFSKLTEAFNLFNAGFRVEESAGLSIEGIKDEINRELKDWDVGVDIEVSPVTPDEIVKNLLKPHVEDNKLGGKRVDVTSFGQGLQRHLVYTLIRISAKYSDKKIPIKKVFNPDYTLILFEEPEAFLHPSQQEVLYNSLVEVASGEDQQVFVSTHSAQFVGKRVDSLPSVCKLHRLDKETTCGQITCGELNNVLGENLAAARAFGEDQGPDFDEQARIANEAIKYFMLLDSERSSLFFARHVLVCEGSTEKVFFDFLADSDWRFLRRNRVYILDSIGKYNIHRFVNLLSQLKIPHSVIFDGDENKNYQATWNQVIADSCTKYTTGRYQFESDLEDYLGIEKPDSRRSDLKPLNLIIKFAGGSVSNAKIEELKSIILNISGLTE